MKRNGCDLIYIFAYKKIIKKPLIIQSYFFHAKNITFTIHAPNNSIMPKMSSLCVKTWQRHDFSIKLETT